MPIFVYLDIISPISPEDGETYTTSTIPVDIVSNATTVVYNVKNGTQWVFSTNQTYSGSTNMTGFVNGTYTFYAWATVDSVTVENYVGFNVTIPETPPQSVTLNIIEPKNMTYTTGSIDVEISTNATSVEYNIKRGDFWIYPTKRLPATLLLD